MSVECVVTTTPADPHTAFVESLVVVTHYPLTHETTAVSVTAPVQVAAVVYVDATV